MKIVDRYLLREYLLVLTYCLLGFSMIFVVYDLFEHLSDFLEASTPWSVVLKYYGLFVIPFLEFLIPASLLLSTLYTLWHMSRNNELTAMRASGISFYRTMAPFLAVGLFAVIVSGAVKEWAAPRAAMWTREFTETRLRGEERSLTHENVAYYNSGERREWLVDEFDLRRPRRLVGVEIKVDRPDGTRRRKITAARAEYLDRRWWLFGMQVQECNAQGAPIGTPVPQEPDPALPVETAFTEETPNDFVTTVKQWELLSTSEMLHYLKAHPRLPEETVAHKRYDLHSRLAMPWTCLIVTLFGIPAGARTSRQNTLTSVFLALALFLLFYALIQAGLLLGKRQLLPPWAGAWLPNAAFSIAGLWMVLRMR